MAIAALLATPRLARGQDGGEVDVEVDVEVEIVRGVVLKVEQQEIYIGLGSNQGLANGAPIRIKRPVQLKHPITRALVEDWVPVATASITQVGGAMSRAVSGAPAGEVKVGDLAEVLLVKAAPQPAPGAGAPATPPGPPVDPATLEVLQAFTAQIGLPLEARIAGWERFRSTRASSPYAADVERELAALRLVLEQLSTGSDSPRREVVTRVKHLSRPSTRLGGEVPLVFVIEQPERVASAFLHFRTSGARSFRRLLLDREHELYLRGTIPAELITPPGIEYFVEVSAPDGSSSLALASPEEPVKVTVAPPPLLDQITAAPGQSSVRITFDHLDFATFDKRRGDRTDQLTSATIDFLYRLRGPVDSLGVGYGTFLGEGGFADQAWSPDAPAPRTGFQYGYADIELGTSPQPLALSAGAKVIAGVGRDGFGLGIEGRVRIGSRDAANLQLLASTLEEVGFLSTIRLGVSPLRHLLVGVSVGATDQPGRGDIGVKLGTELEWTGLSRFSMILRGSWQGRTIDHGGIGGGGGLGVSW
jgi:hypothetical protein